MTNATAHDWKAQQMARDVAAKALAAANPHLVAIGGKVDGLQAAAKNIRIELKAAFPAVKFSVKSRRFSGGDAIDVRWTDGPTADQVDAIVQRYAAGRFDGMTDCYDYRRDAWRDAFGDAMYIHANRDNSERAIASAIRTVAARLGLEQLPTVEQHRAGALWNVCPAGLGGEGLQGEINRTAARRTWAIAKRAA
jgi:hypothetical protein